MKIANLFAVFVVNDVAQTTVVDALRSVFRVPDNFIDEVAEVKHEPEAILFRSAFVLENHSPVRILSPWFAFWQETNANRTGLLSLSVGAVMVLPTRLP